MPGSFLGVLRRIAPGGSMKGHFVELQGDLMRLNAGPLAERPLIHDLTRPAYEA